MRLYPVKRRITAWLLILAMMLGMLPVEEFATTVYAGDTVELTVRLEWEDYGYDGQRPGSVTALLRDKSGDAIGDSISLTDSNNWTGTRSVDTEIYESGEYSWSLSSLGSEYVHTEPETIETFTTFTIVPFSTSPEVKVEVGPYKVDGLEKKISFDRPEIGVGLGDRRYLVWPDDVETVESSDPEILKVIKIEPWGDDCWVLVPKKRAP